MLSLSHSFAATLNLSPLLHIYHWNHLLELSDLQTINIKYFIFGVVLYYIFLVKIECIQSVKYISSRLKINNGSKWLLIGTQVE